jgi:hypothetical protein
VYGTYERNLTSNSSFSVPFTANASTPILFMSGDQSLYLVARYANVTTRTTDFGLTFNALHSSGSGLTDVVFSFVPSISASGTAFFRGLNTADPRILSGMNVFYQEQNATSNTTILSRGGANVLIYNPAFCARMYLTIFLGYNSLQRCVRTDVCLDHAHPTTHVHAIEDTRANVVKLVGLNVALRILILQLCVELDAAL